MVFFHLMLIFVAAKCELELHIVCGLKSYIRCPLQYNPLQAVIVWSKNLSPISNSSIKNRVYVNENGYLVFNPVVQEDTDVYSCLPYLPNYVNLQIVTIILKVDDIPEFVLRPLPKYHKYFGESVTLPCYATGNPQPFIYWRKTDSTFPSTTKTLFDGSNLTIAHLTKEEEGYYECYATNFYSTIVSSTYLIVQEQIVNQPYNVRSVSTSGSMTLTWSPPHMEDGLIYNYKVCLKEASLGNWLYFTDLPEFTTSLTIYNLKPSADYEIVIATTRNNLTVYSSTLYVHTQSVTDMCDINVYNIIEYIVVGVSRNQRFLPESEFFEGPELKSDIFHPTPKPW
ncbi:hypothetical protein HELRODRAFT_158819 [Helobdella robusta]|uniref:Uncharacterized protein n=1 Tax=Helobdella robusta TaxID=6412 RepID=T1ENB0_HELRO|nr:hypothetical protein HELRODRAFT_158819 [Helobdella robusta]ESO12323.1 hypothetical protein HELRODRAFT_158819 [Helobdella robusta]